MEWNLKSRLTLLQYQEEDAWMKPNPVNKDICLETGMNSQQQRQQDQNLNNGIREKFRYEKVRAQDFLRVVL